MARWHSLTLVVLLGGHAIGGVTTMVSPRSGLAGIHGRPGNQPVAYFISFRTYGTWLHGDERGSVSPKQNVFGTSKIAPNELLRESARDRMRGPAVKLLASARSVVESTVREVCGHRGWKLHEVNVRTNHVHVVVTASKHSPERVTEDLKAWYARRLREAGILAADQKPWSRGGSNPYLWTEGQLREKCAYVREGQGEDLD